MQPPKYNLHSYAAHIRDTPRVKAYISALERAMFPGAVVIDLGAGTGFFSLLACQLGAGHVYAIEPNGLVDFLPKQAEANGYGDRITVIRQMSTEVDLPERADILITDLRGGMFPLFQTGVVSIHDACQRLLKEEAVIIPQKDIIYVAVISDEELYQKQILTPWIEGNYGVDMSLALPSVLNMMLRHGTDAEKLLLPGMLWAEIDYASQSDPSIKSTITWSVDQPGRAHFIATWFDAHIAEGITYSTAPGTPKEQRPNTYDGAYFPLQEPIDLELGDSVIVTLHASYAAIKRDYTFIWETEVRNSNGVGKIKYRQSNFFNQRIKLQSLTESQTDE